MTQEQLRMAKKMVNDQRKGLPEVAHYLGLTEKEVDQGMSAPEKPANEPTGRRMFSGKKKQP